MSTYPDQTEKCKRQIEDLLEAEPFVPFEIECGPTVFIIRAKDQCRFNHRGTLVVKTPDGHTHFLFAIVRVSMRADGTE